MEQKSINFEREPIVGSAVRLAVKTINGYSIDVQPTAYLGHSNGTYSFIRPAAGIGICVSETSQGNFGRDDNVGIVFYSDSYQLKFVSYDEEGYEGLESKLLASGIWRKK